MASFTSPFPYTNKQIEQSIKYTIAMNRYNKASYKIEKMRRGLFPNMNPWGQKKIHWLAMFALLLILGFAKEGIALFVGLFTPVDSYFHVLLISLIFFVMWLLSGRIKAWIVGAGNTEKGIKYLRKAYKKLDDREISSLYDVSPWKEETGLTAKESGIFMFYETPESAKGTFFEFLVYSELVRNVNPIHEQQAKGYYTAAHVYMPVEDKTTEADIVQITPYGIFVLECKATPGAYTGNDEEKDWEYCIGQNVHRVYNPLMQNEGHIRALRHLIYTEPLSPAINISQQMPIYNVMVVYDECDTGGVKITKPGNYIVHLSNLAHFFTVMQEKATCKIPSFVGEELAARIQTRRVRDKAVIDRHVSNIQFQQSKF